MAGMMIYTGRFQPFHKGHVWMVRSLTEKYPEETVCVAVVKDVPIVHARTFDKFADTQLNHLRNPFNCAITLNLIEQVLRDEKLADVVVTLIPRPSVETWTIINALFDCDRTWVFTENKDAVDDWENSKEAFFKEQGEKTVRIEIEKSIEGTLIREAIAQNDYAFLSSVLPDAVLRFARQCESSRLMEAQL